MKALWIAAVALAACRSAPSKYYTLVGPPAETTVAPGGELQIDVLPVDVPPEVDRAEMVVRRGPGEVTPVETRSWIAPLALEIRRALSDDLTHELGARDIAELTAAPGVPTYRIKLAVQRFESALGDHAVIEASWTVREGSGAPLVCSVRASDAATGDYAGLAEAHQRALATVAKSIAAGVRAMRGGSGAGCP
jgi:hypothetical protein